MVRAIKGDRTSYRPILSSLCSGSHPEDIVAALLELHPFDTVYIADLDAILGRADNTPTLVRMKQRHPAISFWVDAGLGDPATLNSWLLHGVGRPVIGTETLINIATLDGARAGSQLILSLDYRADTFLGPQQLAVDTQRWPHQVIAMTLSRVGSGAGPDLRRLQQLRRQAPRHDIFAAGGVRHGADLDSLMQLGVAGVLLASALHDGALVRSDLTRYG